MGDWQDKTLKSLRRLKLWQVVQNRPSLMQFPNGETFAAAQQRFTAEIQAIAAMHKPKDLVVCVSHSDLIKLAVAYYMGLSLDLFQRLIVSPASISTLHFAEGQAMVYNVNTTVGNPFLAPKHRKKPAAKKK